MKIGFDAKRAFLNSSGLGNYSRNTLYALKKYFAKNHYVLFTPKTTSALFPDVSGFEIVSPKKFNSKLYKLFWRSFILGRRIEQNQLDIFHGLSNELPKEFGGNTKIPTVVTIHDLIFLRFPNFYHTLDRKIYLQKVKYACQSAHTIVAISEQTKNDIVRFLHISPEKIVVIHQCVSPVYFENKGNEDLKEKYKLPENFILSVGTLEQRKNQLSTVKAMLALKIEMPIVFVGKQTPYWDVIQKFVDENNMQKQVIILSNIPETDLAGLYRLAFLSIYTSLFEGFGLPVIESMACGCPVITSNVSCLPETAGDAAILCDPHNSRELGLQIERVLADANLRQELIRKGKERAQIFHPKNYSEKLISLYCEIVK